MDYSFILAFIKPELLILAIILYFVGMAFKSSKVVKDALIPFILCGISIVICLGYVFGTTDITSTKGLCMALFTALVQGFLCAAAPTYVDNFIRQAKELKDGRDNNMKTPTPSTFDTSTNGVINVNTSPGANDNVTRGPTETK
jgi:hypothetical protein